MIDKLKLGTPLALNVSLVIVVDILFLTGNICFKYLKVFIRV